MVLVRNLFGRAIDLGRQYNRTRNKADFYEALRLLGTGCHCLEDYSAHSNYTELALIELGERDVFPHVGRRTQTRLQGVRQPVYPIVTGTFGGVDFLHSVMGELDDKTTQSEVQELEGVMQESQGRDTSVLRKLLSALPSGLFGGKNQAAKVDELQANATAAQMNNMDVSPRQPEQWTRQLNQVSKEIYPIIEFHDNIMKGITETIEKIPILPDLIEQLQEQVSVFVFSLLAPFVLPIIRQVKEELATGSSEVIESSREKQLIVFHDDSSSDPTHSMLSKDHFSNILNEPAGRIGCAVLRWVVPQIVSCWDDERIDIGQTLNRIINGVFHHPALRTHGDDGARDGRLIMFGVVQQWWGDKSDYERGDLRQKLSRQGVETGQNHKEGVRDSGHGCGKPIGLGKPSQNNAPAAAAHAAVMNGLNQAFNGSGQSQSHGSRPSGNQGFQQQVSQEAGNFIGEAVGGGALGSIVGGLVGGVGASLLGSAFESGGRTQTFQNQNYNPDGSFTSTVMETGERPQAGRYGHEQTAQAEYKTTQFPGGGYRQEYNRFDQEGRAGHGYEQSTETRPMQGGGYEQRSEKRWERPDGRWESEVQNQRIGVAGNVHQTEEKHHGRRHSGRDESDDSSDDNDDWEKKERKERARAEKKERKRREEEEKNKFRHGRDDSDDEDKHGHKKHGSGHQGHFEEQHEHGRRGSNDQQQQHHEQHGRRGSREREHDHQQQRPGHGNQFSSAQHPEHANELFDERRHRYEQSSSGYRRQQNFDPSFEPPRPGYGGGFEQGPPPSHPGFGGNGYGDNYYAQPPPRPGYSEEYGGGGGGYGRPPPPREFGQEYRGEQQEYGDNGYGPGGDERRQHGRGGHGQGGYGGGGGW